MLIEKMCEKCGWSGSDDNQVRMHLAGQSRNSFCWVSVKKGRATYYTQPSHPLREFFEQLLQIFALLIKHGAGGFTGVLV